MSEQITLRGICGKIIKGKLWKQGGSMKCPTHWSFITYPKPERIDLWRDINSLCRGCESIDSDSLRSTRGKSDEMRVLPQSGVEASRTPLDSIMGDEEASIIKHKKRSEP